MPVFPIVENAAFRPPLLELMGDAFDTAMGLLSVVPSKIAQEAMANRIIQAAHEGERDIERLRQVALTGMSVPTNSEFGRPFSGAGGVLRDQVAPV